MSLRLGGSNNTQPLAFPPQFFRLENSFGGNDAGDEFCGRYVEGGVSGGTGGVGDLDLAECSAGVGAPGGLDFGFIIAAIMTWRLWALAVQSSPSLTWMGGLFSVRAFHGGVAKW